MSLRLKKFLLLSGDIALFFISLILILIIRYPRNFSYGLSIHLAPFSIILPIWLLAFYIAGLYEPKLLKNTSEFLKTLFAAIGLNALLTVSFLYLTPVFGITPRLNLFLFLLVFFLLEVAWRQFFNALLYRGQSYCLLLIGSGPTTDLLADYLIANPQLGFHIEARLDDQLLLDDTRRLEELLSHRRLNLIVIPEHLKHRLAQLPSLYRRLPFNLEVVSTARFFELILQKIPLSDIQNVWLLDNLARGRRYSYYRLAKNILEPLLALLLMIIALPFVFLISLAIKFSSPGPVIYKQTRIGHNERQFTLYKFRTMIKDAEPNGPLWASPEDHRLTPLGRFLKHTHLDELPQLWNIILGQLSFVGPRPERPEFVATLKDQIPFYSLRHLVKPGITGWAQINYRYGSSVSDARNKLEYELYYLKNSSLLLDLSIIIRTVKTIFTNPE